MTIWASYYEVVNDQINDLQVVESTDLNIKENPYYGTYVEGLRVVSIQSIEDIDGLFSTGKSIRDYRYCSNTHSHSA